MEKLHCDFFISGFRKSYMSRIRIGVTFLVEFYWQNFWQKKGSEKNMKKRKNEQFTPFSMVFLLLIILLTNIFAIGETANICEMKHPKKC